MNPDDPTTPPHVENAGERPKPDDPPQDLGPPRFEVRAFWTPKRGNSENEWEDGYVADPERGTLAIADGASDGVFTRHWVRQLLSGYCQRPVPLNDPAATSAWISVERRGWLEAIDYPSLRWSLQRKVDRSCAAATFLGFQIEPTQDGEPVGWSAWAVGDVCLFHVRDGELTSWFPVENSSAFGTTPDLYQSKPIRPTPVAAERRGDLLPEDMILFATDALACRILSAVEQGDPPDWRALWDTDQESWLAQIERDRDAGLIVNDDCTLVLLRLPRASPPALEEPDETTQDQDEEVDWPWDSDAIDGATVVDEETPS
ncbi:MAG: hypothetical protein AB7I30_05375 [Isosphaeraceae bacterium]